MGLSAYGERRFEGSSNTVSNATWITATDGTTPLEFTVDDLGTRGASAHSLGRKIILVCTAKMEQSAAGSRTGIRVMPIDQNDAIVGSTPVQESESIMELNTTANGNQYFWFHEITLTQDRGYRVQINSPSGNAASIYKPTLFYLDLTGREYSFSSVDLSTSLTTTDSTSNNASVTFTAGINDKYLVFATQKFDPTVVNSSMYGRIEFTGETGLDLDYALFEAENANDTLFLGYSRPFTASSAGSKTITLQARCETGTQHNRELSALFVLKLVDADSGDSNTRPTNYGDFDFQSTTVNQATNYGTEGASVSFTPTGAASDLISSNCARVASDTTTSNTAEDMDGSSFTVTLPTGGGEIMAVMSVAANLSTAGTGSWLISIDGTTSPVTSREFSGATDDGSVSVVFRSGTLTAGAKTVKAQHYTTAGTLTSADVTLAAWCLVDDAGNAIDSAWDTVATDSTTATSPEAIDGLSVSLDTDRSSKVVAFLAGSASSNTSSVTQTTQLSVGSETFDANRVLSTASDVGAYGICAATQGGHGTSTTVSGLHATTSGTLTSAPVSVAAFSVQSPTSEVLIPHSGIVLGADSTTSSTLVDINGAEFSVSIFETTRIVVGLSASIENTTGSSQDASISLQVVGQQTKTVTRTIANQNDLGNVTIYECTDALQPGEYTIKAQWSTTGGTLSAAANAISMVAFGAETNSVPSNLTEEPVLVFSHVRYDGGSTGRAVRMGVCRTTGGNDADYYRSGTYTDADLHGETNDNTDIVNVFDCFVDSYGSAVKEWNLRVSANNVSADILQRSVTVVSLLGGSPLDEYDYLKVGFSIDESGGAPSSWTAQDLEDLQADCWPIMEAYWREHSEGNVVFLRGETKPTQTWFYTLILANVIRLYVRIRVEIYEDSRGRDAIVDDMVSNAFTNLRVDFQTAAQAIHSNTNINNFYIHDKNGLTTFPTS